MTDASILVGYKQPDLNAPSPRTPVWLWLITLLLLGVVVVIQQMGQEPGPTRQERLDAAAGVEVEPPGVSSLVVFGKLVLIVKKHAPQQLGEVMRLAEQQAGVQERPGAVVVNGTAATGRDGGGEAEQDGAVADELPLLSEPDVVDEPDAPAIEGSLPGGETAEPGAPPADNSARGPPIPAPATSRFRVALLEAEAYGAGPALERMDALAGDLDPASPLHEDIAAARLVLESGPGALDPGAADALVERHGWFGRLLLSYEQPDTDPFRQGAMLSATWGFAFLGMVMVELVLAIIAGIVILIIGGVMGLSGKLRPAMARPRAGNRLWLETFAVFIAGFLLVQVGVALATRNAPDDAAWPVWVRLGSQWSLALLVFWPMLRGMSFERFRGEVGWHRGKGYFNEVGAGVLTYLAALPVYFGLALILVSIMMLYRQLTGAEDVPPPTPDDRLTELLSRGVGVGLLLASLVVIWAPLVEETIFRGALYRAVRSPLGAGGAALLTAAVFAVMHAYAALQLILVGTLGLIFAFMREWRGSLIPSITAHCLHNSIVLVVIFVMIQLARG